MAQAADKLLDGGSDPLPLEANDFSRLSRFAEHETGLGQNRRSLLRAPHVRANLARR